MGKISKALEKSAKSAKSSQVYRIETPRAEKVKKIVEKKIERRTSPTPDPQEDHHPRVSDARVERAAPVKSIASGQA
jgi:hypothetical protein